MRLAFSANGKKLILHGGTRPERVPRLEAEFLHGQAKWSQQDKGWAFPRTVHTALLLSTIYPHTGVFGIEQEVRDWVTCTLVQSKLAVRPDFGREVIRTGLRDYQSGGARFLQQRPAALLADSVGLGKTRQAIAAAAGLEGLKLVVCPNPLKHWWEQQIRTLIDAPVVVAGQGADAVPCGLDGPAWLIVHYEAARMPANLERLRKVIWDVIILDEAHRIKNRKTQTAKALKKLRAKRRWALTATPYANLPDDLFSILQWLRPGLYTSYWKFFALYTRFIPTNWGYSGLGPKSKRTLAWELSDIMLRREPEDVFGEVPPVTHTTIPVVLEGQQLASYDLVRVETLIELESGHELTIPNMVARMVRLRQVVTDPRQIGLPGQSAKLAAVEALLNMSDEPVVVFTQFRLTAQAIGSRSGPGKSVKPRSVYIGGCSDEPVGSFQRGETDVLVGTISAMGEGLNLQRARRAIFVNLPWSLVKWHQAVGRIRPGIGRPTEVVTIEARRTIDQVVRSTLENKLSGAQAVYDALKAILTA